MKLSDEELRWLSRQEKQQRLWIPVTRWVCLGGGLLSAGFGAFLLHEAAKPYLEWLAMFALLLFVKAGLWIGVALSNWRGHVKLRLLVRLIREHEDKDA
jgi:hypothetical protein